MSPSRSSFVWYAAFLLTGAVAVYGLTTSLSLRSELQALKQNPTTFPLAEAPNREPKEPLGVGSDADRIQALEDAVRRQENEISALQLSLVSLAQKTGGLEVGPDGELTGAAADSVRSLLEKDQEEKRKERQEARLAELSSRLAEHREAFAQANQLSSDQKEQLSTLEESTKKVVSAFLEEVNSGSSTWRDIRPQARELATDTMRQLNEILGEEKAGAYLDSLQEDLPMLARWRGAPKAEN